jgi:hypothetical protein
VGARKIRVVDGDWVSVVIAAFQDTYCSSVLGGTLRRRNLEGGVSMYGVFGSYTQWAVVFLIIFVLFFLLVPSYGGAAGAGAGAVY